MEFLNRVLDAGRVLRKGASVGPLIDDSRIWRTLRQIMGDKVSVTQPYAQSVWVYSTIKTIAENLSQVPFQIGTKASGDEEFKVQEEGDLQELFKNPNPYMSGETLFEATYTYMGLRGEAFWILDGRENVTQIPSEIWTFDPIRFQPMHDKESGLLLGWKYKGKKTVVFPVDQVIHFKYFNPYDDIRGLAPLTAVQSAIDQDFYSNEYNKTFFESGATVGGFISADKPLTPEQFNRLKDQFDQRHKGAKNAHKVGILEGGMTFQDAKITQKDMEFIKGKKITREEIFAAFKMNAVVMGIYDDIKSYEGIKTAHRSFWQECLTPKAKYMMKHLNQQFFGKIQAGRQTCRLDLAQVEALQEDLSDKLDSAEKLKSLGYPVNMINQRLGLGMEEVEWGDEQPNQNLALNPGDEEEKNNPNDKKDDKKKALPGIEHTGAIEVKQAETLEAVEEIEDEEPDFHTPEEAKKWKEFETQQLKVEELFKKKIKKFFFEQRSRVLKNLSMTITKDLTDMVFFSDEETNKLTKLLAPIYEVSVQTGVEGVATELGMMGFVYDPLDSAYLGIMQMKLRNIPPVLIGTIQKQLRATLIEGVSAGEGVTALSDRVRKVFNSTASRALMIARTETASAINAGRVVEMTRQGVTKHRWLTAGDEHVRDTHRQLNGQIAEMGIKFAFKSGAISTLRYPGDSGAPAREVINCRCIALPVEDDLEPQI
ncbi:MAG: phage portal protein [Deltaproteobacteria bacterium]|nr:phage portal protein [Deltaproteobacteria bacterium]